MYDSIQQYLHDTRVAEELLEYYLVEKGWRETSITPGALSLWECHIGDRTVAVPRDTAVYIQSAIEADQSWRIPE
jgi:hypothetical protein